MTELPPETGIVTRATIDEIEAHRNRALTLYADAFDALEAAKSAQLAAANGEVPAFAFGRYTNATDFRGKGERDKFMHRVRQEVDRGIWSRLMTSTKLDTLMDRKAREQFRQQLADDPPEITADNCYATIERFAQDSGMIFRRGVAEAFSGLDRRFRSHDGFKIGSRVILTYGFGDGGSMNTRVQEIVRDVERAFCVLDGRPPPEWSEGICAKVSVETQGWGRQAFQTSDDYFTLKGFKNGNAHLWFKRDDLLERVNLLLAEHYGAALGEGSDVADQHAGVRSTAVARNMGFFPTPPAVAEKVFERGHVPTYAGHGQCLTILEPSAGTGSLAVPAIRGGHKVTCVELHPGRAAELRGYICRVVQADFLEVSTDALGLFDRVIMNPPFDRGLDVDHVRHAFDFLRPGGVLCAIMSASTEFRSDARTVAFREWAARLKHDRHSDAIFRDLPAGSFAEVGTYVNTVTLTLRKPG